MSAVPRLDVVVLAGRLRIGGEEVPAQTLATYVVSNPATGSAVAEVADAGDADVARAVGAARTTFAEGPWRRMPAPQRGEVLQAAAALIEARESELARLESLCSGKPIIDCRAEVRAAARYFRYYGAAVNHLTGQTIPVNAGGLDLTLREPIGVCALIVPWNGPIAVAAKKAAPALAAGNSVVLKPAPPTPLTALELEGICREAGVPPGVFNVLTGAGRELGQQLVAHPDVSKISFTGSTETGVDILTRAAAGIKRVSLELGGKSPNVIFADADLAAAAESAIFAVFANSGQDCCARSRMIVERPVFDQFVERLAALAGQVRQGDPLDPEVRLGSLISAGQRERVLGFIDRAASAGAEVVCGGMVVDLPGLEAGNAVAPTVIIGAAPDSEVATTEVFGPVATILPFDDEEQAIALANGTKYGLSGSLWTRDIGRAIRVSREIRSGLLSINSDSSSYIQAPFGGYGQSGLGKEQGLAGLQDFTEVKNIYVSDH
ncbi:MAG TPA: aldehyde dehydrogenase family protein [Streptosporangiaceae bacterium]|nr:aldehyde dehydrogenase family protein [Streptosporangiaceae bacterium]